MFFGKKKTQKTKDRDHRPHANFGIGLPGLDGNSNDDDEDLEAELFKLTGHKSNHSEFQFGIGDDEADLEMELEQLMGKSIQPFKIYKQQKSISNKTYSTGNADCVDSDEGDDVDENDPELLDELSNLVIEDNPPNEDENVTSALQEEKEEIKQVDLIRSRLDMYRLAEETAKKNNESSRARRFNRGVKTLQSQLKKAEKGEFVPYDEIPPEIAINLKPLTEGTEQHEPPKDAINDKNRNDPSDSSSVTERQPGQSSIFECPEVDYSKSRPPSIPSVSEAEAQPKEALPNSSVKQIDIQPSTSATVDPLLELIQNRRAEFKTAALAAKKAGDLTTALPMVKAVKICDNLINNLLIGKSVNASEIPTFGVKPTELSEPRTIIERTQGTSAKQHLLFGEIFTVPATVMEALEQRLSYYTKAYQKAQTSNNRIEARRHNDVIQTYQSAIRLYKKGSRVPFEKLPTPPGCPPIPLSF